MQSRQTLISNGKASPWAMHGHSNQGIYDSNGSDSNTPCLMPLPLVHQGGTFSSKSNTDTDTDTDTDYLRRCPPAALSLLKFDTFGGDDEVFDEEQKSEPDDNHHDHARDAREVDYMPYPEHWPQSVDDAPAHHQMVQRQQTSTVCSIM